MFMQNTDDIDYEDLDDLPLFDHIEWLSNSIIKARLYHQSFFSLEIFKIGKLFFFNNIYQKMLH
jgi:hypothetical protein